MLSLIKQLFENHIFVGATKFFAHRSPHLSFKQQYPCAVGATVKQNSIDDYLDSIDIIAEAQQLISEVKEIQLRGLSSTMNVVDEPTREDKRIVLNLKGRCLYRPDFLKLPVRCWTKQLPKIAVDAEDKKLR